jgi:1,2-diacylglycerol 3-alpha-glucosyltransferase
LRIRRSVILFALRSQPMRERLRIGIIAACPFPAHHGTPGGIREHAEALAELGHQVHVITYAACQPGVVRGVRIHRIPAIGPVHRVVVGPTLAKLFWDLLLVLKTISVVLRYKIDVLHGVNYEGALVGVLARWLTGRPLVYGAVNTMGDELHTYKFIRPVKLAHFMARILDHRVPRLADYVVCCTPTIRNCLLRLGVPAPRVAVVNLGIDLSMFARAHCNGARERMGVRDEPLVVYTGVLNKFQRIDYLLRAMQVVVGQLPQAKLAFVRTLDDPAQRREVEQMARAEGLGDSVIFPDVIRLGDLPAYIAAADTTAVPRPDCPGVPVKLLNFMAVGKPVVVTLGSSQGLRDGEEALVTADHDPQAMGEALLRILMNKGLADRLGHRAREVAYSQYDRLVTARQVVTIYEQLLAEVPRSRSLGELRVRAAGPAVRATGTPHPRRPWGLPGKPAPVAHPRV